MSASDGAGAAPHMNGSTTGHTNGQTTTSATANGDSGAPFSVKAGLAQMLKGGVIMDVINAEQVSPLAPTVPPRVEITDACV